MKIKTYTTRVIERDSGTKITCESGLGILLGFAGDKYRLTIEEAETLANVLIDAAEEMRENEDDE